MFFAEIQQSPVPVAEKRVSQPNRHIVLLLLFMSVMAILYFLLSRVAIDPKTPIQLFLLLWSACFLFYFGVCIWVFRTKPLKRWSEIAIILGGTVLFHALLLPLLPGLSRDSWRYLWDGKVIAHGYSPYLYAPVDKLFLPLRDNVYVQALYRDFTTKYPPGIELVYLLGYLLTPTSLFGMKLLFIICDVVTCMALIIYLMRCGNDPRRVILYAWCPLPIVEFALEGHGEAVTVVCIVLASLCARSFRPRWHFLAGIFLGIATLCKLYPIILLLAIVRKRDWGLVLACFITIILGYLPFLYLSHWHISEVVFSFAGQAEEHRGVLQNVLRLVGYAFNIPLPITIAVITLSELALILTAIFVVLLRRRHIGTEAAILLLLTTVLIVYANVFPWYTTVLLPWIALLIEPLWGAKGLNVRGIIIALVWYFTFVVIASYIPGLRPYNKTVNWLIYYGISFGVMLIGLGLSVWVHLWPRLVLSIDALKAKKA